VFDRKSLFFNYYFHKLRLEEIYCALCSYLTCTGNYWPTAIFDKQRDCSSGRVSDPHRRGLSSKPGRCHQLSGM